MKTEILNIIARLENNISALEKEIASGYFQKGYNLNCQQSIESYKQQIKQLKKMETTTTTKKITLATVKSFIKKNSENLFVKMESSFSGMNDCVEHDKNAQFKPATKTESNLKYTLGVEGVWVTGNWNIFTPFENDEFTGIEIYNCCGTSLIAIKK